MTEPQPFSHQIGSDQTGRTVLRLIGEPDMAASPTLTTVLHQLQVIDALWRAGGPGAA